MKNAKTTNKRRAVIIWGRRNSGKTTTMRHLLDRA